MQKPYPCHGLLNTIPKLANLPAWAQVSPSAPRPQSQRSKSFTLDRKWPVSSANRSKTLILRSRRWTPRRSWPVARKYTTAYVVTEDKARDVASKLVTERSVTLHLQYLFWTIRSLCWRCLPQSHVGRTVRIVGRDPFMLTMLTTDAWGRVLLVMLETGDSLVMMVDIVALYATCLRKCTGSAMHRSPKLPSRKLVTIHSRATI